MTAKEMLNKRKFNTDEPIHLSESEVVVLMNDFAVYVAEQAVEEERSKLDESVFMHKEGNKLLMKAVEIRFDKILYRIKELTQ